jgi:hypothetical protein
MRGLARCAGYRRSAEAVLPGPGYGHLLHLYLLHVSKPHPIAPHNPMCPSWSSVAGAATPGDLAARRQLYESVFLHSWRRDSLLSDGIATQEITSFSSSNLNPAVGQLPHLGSRYTTGNSVSPNPPKPVRSVLYAAPDRPPVIHLAQLHGQTAPTLTWRRLCRRAAVLNEMAANLPTQRDRHLRASPRAAPGRKPLAATSAPRSRHRSNNENR